jgi:hypothetical protein
MIDISKYKLCYTSAMIKENNNHEKITKVLFYFIRFLY